MQLKNNRKLLIPKQKSYKVQKMRIRSIKYKSNFINQSDESQSNQQSNESQQNLDVGKVKGRHIKLRQLFTQQYFNIPQESETDEVSFQNRIPFISNVNNQFTNIKSQKINLKGQSLHASTIKLKKYSKEKQNRTSIFQQKTKSLSKLIEVKNKLANQNLSKLRCRLSKFSEHRQTLLLKESTFCKTRQSDNPNQGGITTCDQIILGQNITYQAQCLQNSVLQIQDQMRKQKNKIDKIRKQVNLYTSKIQRQLDNITKQIRKGFQNLNIQLTKSKNQKCSILINWRSVISMKNQQYREEQQLINIIQQKIDQLQCKIQEGPNYGQIDIRDSNDNQIE